MFKTALAQLRFAASVGLGRPFAQWSLDHLIDAIKETRREFGAIDVEEGGSHLGGPVLDEETRRELHLRRFRTQAVRAAQETSYYAHLFERLALEPDRLRFEDIANLRPYEASWTRGTTTGGYGSDRPLHDSAPGYAEPGSGALGRSTEQFRGAEGGRITRSEEELDIDKRERTAGEVRVGKHVETERVSEPVTRERERVRIETRPASGPAQGSERFQDEEIVIPVKEEEISVSKRPVTKEELVISKDRVKEDETVQADLRKERFDIEDEGQTLDESRRRGPKGGR